MKLATFILSILMSVPAFGIDQLTDGEFYKKVTASKGYVLVDFYEDWCGPCQQAHPILEKMEKHYKNVKFYQIRASDAPNASNFFNVRYIPKILIFKDGGDYEELMFSNEVDLNRELQSYLNRGKR